MKDSLKQEILAEFEELYLNNKFLDGKELISFLSTSLDKVEHSLLSRLKERVEKMERYDLEDDGGCGDPECCGTRDYFVGKVENGEYLERSTVLSLLQEEGLEEVEEK